MIGRSQLRKLLTYNPQTGEFFWIRRSGQKAGHIKPHFNPAKGPRHMIKIKGRNFEAHRLAFLYMLDYMPYQVDHKDRDSLNNCWSNLRVCNQAQNNMNRAPRKTNKYGCSGIFFDSSRNQWRAGIGFNKEHIRLGSFDSLDEAIVARKEAEEKFYGEFAFNPLKGERP